MMTQAFYTGVSGIRTHQQAIDITSDNLANISTTGFRGYEYEFTSLFEKNIQTTHDITTSSVGIGSRVQATALKEAQGTLQLSDSNTDIAIRGNGWFALQGQGAPEYTRDGAFSFDRDGSFVSQDGLHVLGTMAKNINNGVLQTPLDTVALGAVGAQEKLQFPQELRYPAQATTKVSYAGNLGSLDNPDTKSTMDAIRTIGATAIDAQNNKNNIKMIFTPLIPQPASGVAWNVNASSKSLDGTQTYDTQTGQINFDETGALISHTLGTINNNGVDVAIDFGSQYSGIVSHPNHDVYSSSSSDGVEGGDLEGYSINRNGEVIASFSNGRYSAVGRVGVFHFQNDQGLERINGSRFTQSSNSGEAFFHQDANGNNILGSDIVNFQLEGSNIDMSYGITELIILQRAFDANSKSITTADQMMQKALSMDA